MEEAWNKELDCDPAKEERSSVQLQVRLAFDRQSVSRQIIHRHSVYHHARSVGLNNGK